MFFQSLIMRVSPSPKWVFQFLGQDVGRAYAGWRLRSAKALVSWHKAQLMNLDPGFAMQEWDRELVRRRQEAMEQGVGPDARYPNIFDVYENKLQS